MESFVVGAVVSMKILYKSLDKFGIGIIYFCQVFILSISSPNLSGSTSSLSASFLVLYCRYEIFSWSRIVINIFLDPLHVIQVSCQACFELCLDIIFEFASLLYFDFTFQFSQYVILYLQLLSLIGSNLWLAGQGKGYQLSGPLQVFSNMSIFWLAGATSCLIFVMVSWPSERALVQGFSSQRVVITRNNGIHLKLLENHFTVTSR